MFGRFNDGSDELAEHSSRHASILRMRRGWEGNIGMIVTREKREKQRTTRFYVGSVEIDVGRNQKADQILAKLEQIVERREQNESFGNVPRCLADCLES